MTDKQIRRIIRAIEQAAPCGAFDVRSLALFLRTDASTILRWASCGIIPRPTELDPPGPDGSVAIRRWVKQTIDRWTEQGCPTCEPPAECEFNRWRHDWVCEDFSARANAATQDAIRRKLEDGTGACESCTCEPGQVPG